jgi:hypothetical protein
MAKNYKEFELKRPDFKDSIKIRMYKTPEAMRRGFLAEKARYTKQNDDDMSGTMGLFFDTPYMVSDTADGRFIGDMYGIMFLNEKVLTPEIVIHECIHTSFAHERNIERFDMNYSDDGPLIHEERFAYFCGWLAAEVMQLLKKQGYLR